MTLARGSLKVLTIVEEVPGAFATASPSVIVPLYNGAGQILRRTNANFTVTSSPISSSEELLSKQETDWWLGPRVVEGTLSGLLSSGSYNNLLEGMFRSRLTQGAQAINTPDVVVVWLNGGLVVTSISTDFLGSGFRNGDVVRISGRYGPTPNDETNFRVIGITSNELLLYSQDAVYFVGSPQVNVAVPGQKIVLPSLGEIPLSYSVEEWFPDVGVSQLSAGCRLSSLQVGVPASGFCTLGAGLQGVSMQIGALQAFQNPAAATVSAPVTASGGQILVAGYVQGAVTSLTINMQADLVADDVEMGYDVPRFIYCNKVKVSGSVTVMMTPGDGYMPDFLLEQPVQISVLATDSLKPGAGFVSVSLPMARLSRASWQDSDTAIVRTFGFEGLQQTTDTTWDQSAIVIQQG